MNKNLEKFLRGLEEKSNFLLIDLEANSQNEGFQDGIILETIQIGFIVFDYNFQILNKGSIFIKPRLNSKLSDFIKGLTGIKQDSIDAGLSFKDGLEKMVGLMNKYNCSYILSYGNYDMKQFFSDCKINEISYPFFEGDTWHFSKHINIKNALASKLNIKEKGMENLLKYLGLNLEGTHHNGEDDCYNILQLIKNQFK
ncbi:exonuclease domain-containing protein [Candidatus Gracilibacteria bacterium]|nr:exonuclease domain-containing protein [Candidatus Gracilibacteria bacterium]